MNDMVSGIDVTFDTPKEQFDLSPLLDAILDVWPDALIQNADEGAARSLGDAFTDPEVNRWRELFVYRDQASADSWLREGWTEAHSNGMVHFLVVEDAAHPDTLQLTIVVGSIIDETAALLDVVFDAKTRLARGERKAHSRRVNWDADLRDVGFSLGRDKFYEKIAELRERFYPDWTADELACHPYVAMQFCEVVRHVVPAVPDHLVMKALMNRRRQGK